jgi:RNA polymerase sigma-70 factor, ECF subfamily
MHTVDFGALYERYSNDVMRFALYLTGRRTEAEDIASETFVRAWLSRAPIRSGTVKSYLLAIARNLHVERHRLAARQGSMPEDMADPAPGPEAWVSGRDDVRALVAELQRLPEIDRAALLMKAQEGLSYNEIAAALEISVAAARVKVHRARLRLHEWRTARS